MRSIRHDVVVLVGAALLAAVPLIFGAYWTGLLTQALIFAGFAIGLDILVGSAGMASLGHAAFFGLAGYGTAIGILRWDIDPWLAALLGIAVSVGAAAAFAPLAVRVRGLAFLTVMLAFGQVAWGLATRGGSFTGGENGLPGVSRPTLDVLGVDLREPDTYYLFTLSCAVAITLAIARFARSPVGLSLIGIRDNEIRIASLGYDVHARRIAAFVVAASAGAIYGVLNVFLNGFVGPGTLDWRLSAQMLLSVVIGGAGTLWGPFLAGGGLHIIKTYLVGETQRWPMVLGGLYVTAVVLLPGGLASLPAVARSAHSHMSRLRFRSPSRRP